MIDTNRILIANSVVGGVSGIFLNVLLLFVVAKRTTRAMKHYARLILVHPLIDIGVVLTNMLFQTEAFPLNGQIFMTYGGVVWGFGPDSIMFVSCLYFFFDMVQLAILPVDYFYRYKVVCKQCILSTRTVALMVICVISGVFMHCVIFCFFVVGEVGGPNTVKENRMMQQVYGTVNLRPYGFTKDNFMGTTVNETMVVLLSVSVVTMLGFVFLKIQQSLRANLLSGVSGKITKVEKQVTRIFFVQSVIPLVFISLPIGAIAGLALCDVDAPVMGLVNRAVMVWCASLKPIALIALVPNYRRFVSGNFGAVSSGSTVKPSMTNRSRMVEWTKT